VAVRTQWTRVRANNEKCIVYSPFNGFTYMVSYEQASEVTFCTLLGLTKKNYIEQLLDPAKNIACCLISSKKPSNPENIKFRFLLLYRFIHRTRTFIPVRWFISIIILIARFQGQLNHTALSIGQFIHDIERKVGFSDCYPRALLTSYFCLRSKLNCDLVIGSLTPTHKMHAWCCTSGTIPYEPKAEHWMYQPLVVMQIND